MVRERVWVIVAVRELEKEIVGVLEGVLEGDGVRLRV